jgi:cytosine/adenosine deaminase-related metal-dependent hydrolase
MRHFFASAIILGSFATAAAAKTVVVHAGMLYDGLSDQPQKNVSVVIDGGVIRAIEHGATKRPDAEFIELGDATLLPGFIDCHVHVAAKLPSRTNAVEDALSHSDIDRAFEGATFVRAMLQQGFTTVRDLGGGDDTVALKHAIAAGHVDGPRILTALEPLGPTAGHGDARSGMDPALDHTGWDNGRVDSASEARLRVRQHRRRGADVIKIMPSGGIASTGDDPRQQLMTDDEMRAAVDTAHALGMKVAAHIYPAGAIEAAVRAGIDSVEHGSFATDETFALMKAKGVFLVPTLSVFDVFYAAARDRPDLLAPGTAAKELANDLLPMKNMPRALKSGVRIAYGTDLGEGDHTLEFKLLVDSGMSPLAAVRSATSEAAELLGLGDHIGAIAVGRDADLIAVAADPARNPQTLRHATFVMRAGVPYRRDNHAVVQD